MKQRLVTPGPSPVPEETLLELAKPVTYHRTAQFRAILAEVLDDLKAVFCTKTPIVPLTAFGTGGMEAAIANCLPPGSKAICLIAGRFGERWRSLCKAFGVEPISVTVPYGQAVTPQQLTDALAKHPDAAAVTATLSETATGVRGDIEAFGQADVGDQHGLLVEDGQGFAGQGRRPGVPQLLQAMFGGRQAIAVEQFDTIAGQPRRHGGTEEIDEGGEEEVAGVLPLGGVGEESVDPLGIEDAFQNTACHDTHGPFLHEGLKETFQ